MTALRAWLVVLIGAALVIGGFALAYPPLGLIVGGLLVLAAGAL
jgi:hypothetical protein